MIHFKHCLAMLLLLLAAAALPASAASSAASSASESIGMSVGSLSGSIQRSSNSSSTTKVADGDYRLIEIAADGERGGMVKLRLQALRDEHDEFWLILPRETVERSQLASGDVVSAHQRPYGLEFVGGAPRQAFFLVLADDWLRELQTKAVAL
jgi:hypothetical protein